MGEAVIRKSLPIGLATCLVVVSAGLAHATGLTLDPADTRIGLTVYAMSMFPQAGHFSAFTGKLNIDPGHPESCHVTVQVQTASLAMPTATGTRMALGPTMLDAALFPTLTYEGDCSSTRTSGTLTLHGVARPLVLSLTHAANGMTASGSLHRQDYAIRGLPGLVGGTIHIDFSVNLPPDLAKELLH